MVESTDKGLPSLGDLEHPLRGATELGRAG